MSQYTTYPYPLQHQQPWPATQHYPSQTYTQYPTHTSASNATSMSVLTAQMERFAPFSSRSQPHNAPAEHGRPLASSTQISRQTQYANDLQRQLGAQVLSLEAGAGGKESFSARSFLGDFVERMQDLQRTTNVKESTVMREMAQIYSRSSDDVSRCARFAWS